MTKQLTAYTILQNCTSTDLGFMPELVTAATDCAEAMYEYYEHATSLYLIQTFYALGEIAAKHNVAFDINQLHLKLFEMSEGKYWD